MRLREVFTAHRWLFLIILSFLLLALILIPVAILVPLPFPLPFAQRGGTDQNIPLEIPQNASLPTAVPTPASTIIQPSAPGTPTLMKLEQVTDQAFGDGDNYVPNSWGQQKNRIIRTSTGDIFTVYISPGQDEENREWHLMHRKLDGTWEQINQGNAGAEPINIVRGPNDEIHLFAWPGTQGKLQHLVSTDLGKTFTSETIPGQWAGPGLQGYSGADVNAQGDIVFFQTGDDQPGTFNWTYYSAATHQWQFHTSTFDWRYTYAFFFPGNHNDLTITAVRDVKREELGYPAVGGFDYLLNSIKYFYISDVNHPSLTQKVVAQVPPQGNNATDVTYLTDSYIDTQGRTHILYNNAYDGPHHIIVENGQVIKDVKLNIEAANKARIIQDALGHFYIITMSQNGKTLNFYPGSASDTDGTQLDPPVKLDISRLPGCTDPDFCHEPTFTEPRAGDALSNTIDGVYGNFTKEIYFQVKLR